MGETLNANSYEMSDKFNLKSLHVPATALAQRLFASPLTVLSGARNSGLRWAHPEVVEIDLSPVITHGYTIAMHP